MDSFRYFEDAFEKKEIEASKVNNFTAQAQGLYAVTATEHKKQKHNKSNAQNWKCNQLKNPEFLMLQL